MEPETRYARSGDVNIAYQVTGEAERGTAELKGVPEPWRLFAVERDAGDFAVA